MAFAEVSFGVSRRKNLAGWNAAANFDFVNTAAKFKLILVSAPTLKVARSLAQAALKKNLIACANVIPHIESHYRWEGNIQQASEVLMLMKSTAACLPALEKLVLKLHPYDTPEFVVIELKHGNRRYLKWVEASCAL